ncbi:methyltransferase [Legionella lansingensis]|uniref:Methyltransferase n=1 Tax=Legionella lansingensis TaxID=45067 RepID=A0A0W0VKV1_9GAMM|nr:tetratricopeptide repeat protein [Legionella lansingensis]KTD20589.1 methyltransferase [Legionella lansingensis]SNV46244.1 methyltransferase [Legionella lansingensis]
MNGKKSTKQDEEALFAEAYLLQRQNQLPEAIKLYEKLLAAKPKHSQALHFLGLAHAQLGDIETAIHFLHQALDLDPKDASLYNNLANAYKKNHQLQEAIEYYEKALELAPNYAQAHHNLATVYASQNEYLKALHHYRLAVHAEPDFATAHFNLGLLLLHNNELAAAKVQFKNVLALSHDHLEANFYLGVLNLEANRLDEAEQAFQNVLRMDNNHVEALTNLGVIALKRNQGQIAVDYFTRALAIDNDHTDARNNLAATFMHHDRFENALMHYDVLLKKEPKNIEYLYNSGVAQMALGHLSEAITHFEDILLQIPEHFASLNNLAAIYIRLEDKERARKLLERAVATNPADKVSQHMLHALSHDELNPKTCPEYAANLFNNYALYYDQHMKEQLVYALPQLIGRTLHHLTITHVENALDLGCGTGLCGVILREIATTLTGVDISAKMLAQAKQKEIYDRLIESELVNFLKQEKQNYDLILAADVLPYFGELDSVLAAITERLSHQGYFIFSVEISEDKPWQLQATARFSHQPAYIKALADKHSLKIIHEEKVIARHQNQAPLAEILFVLQK